MLSSYQKGHRLSSESKPEDKKEGSQLSFGGNSGSLQFNTLNTKKDADKPSISAFTNVENKDKDKTNQSQGATTSLFSGSSQTATFGSQSDKNKEASIEALKENPNGLQIGGFTIY